MQRIPVLGIPFYNRADLLARCLRSIDYPVDKLVIVNQGPLYPERAEELTPSAREYHVIQHPNAGVAGAWNEIIKLFPAPWWMLVNNDIEFAPGDLEKMAKAAHGTNGTDTTGIYYGNHGASFFIITQFGVRFAGLFDENLYPAYLEDCDMSRRMDLLGVPRRNVEGIRSRHGDSKLTGSCTINSDPELARKNGRTHGRNFDYYKAKWGGINGKEIYEHPFNDALWPVWAWRFDPAFRKEQQW